MANLFTPPGRIERRGEHRLFGRLTLMQGVSLLRENGIYRQIESPTDEEVAAAERAYLGGHIYSITDEDVSALTNAGYGDWIWEGDGPPPTIPENPGGGTGTPGYGMGPYGDGAYGGAL